MWYDKLRINSPIPVEHLLKEYRKAIWKDYTLLLVMSPS